jgi:hypothetical protein
MLIAIPAEVDLVSDDIHAPAVQSGQEKTLRVGS